MVPPACSSKQTLENGAFLSSLRPANLAVSGQFRKIAKGAWTILDAKVVGSVLQRLREERGLSQEIVSGLAGIGRTHLSAIERGERKPTLETFYRIGEALHMRPSAVLAEIEAELERNT